MKKKVLFMMIMASLLSVGSLKAQTVTITAGGLATALSGHIGVTSLKVNGTIDARDFQALRTISSTLRSVDLSGITKIDAFQGTGGPVTGSDTYPANEVPTRAFYAMGNLNTIVLPSNAGITSIGLAAFNQVGITELTIPNGVTTIGDNAFAYQAQGVSKLKKVTLPNSVVTLGALAFKNSAIEEVVLSNKLQEIKASTFENTNLASISIPSSVTRIENSAFAGTYSLASISFAADSKLEWLGGMKTFENAAITSLQLPANAKIIDGKLDMTFQGCTNLTAFTIPSNVTEIGNSAFAGTKLTHVELPNSVTSIGMTAFRNAPLTSMKLSENLIKLEGRASWEEGALSGLSQLETLQLPASLKDVGSIGSYAFSGMTSLKKLIVNNPNPDIFDTEVNVFDGINKETAILYVPAEGLTSTVADKNYKTAYLWKDFKNIKAIGSDANNQTVSNFDDITTTVGATVNLTATASSNLPVTYTIADATIATLSGNKLTILKEGETTITAKQAGDGVNHLAVEKTVKLIVVSYNWLEEPTITIEGNNARVVGPAAAITRFTKFFVNNTEVPLTDGKADLTGKTGEIDLKATSADGAEIIKLKITK